MGVDGTFENPLWELDRWIKTDWPDLVTHLRKDPSPESLVRRSTSRSVKERTEEGSVFVNNS